MVTVFISYGECFDFPVVLWYNIVMVITYYGKQFVKAQLGDLVVAFNPIDKSSKHKSVRFGADIAIVSMNHKDFNGISQVTHGSKEPFVISGPGEYEINGVSIKGIAVESQYEKEEKINTVYVVEMDGMTMCFLGGLHSPELKDEVKGFIGDVDILFVPIGGDEVLSASEAHKLATKLESKIIIPVDYEDNDLKDFAKESGKDEVKVVDKLTIKKKDLDGKLGDITILKASS